MKLTAAARNARLDAITAALGSAATLKIYDGTPPATADAALSGNTLLGTLSRPGAKRKNFFDGSSMKSSRSINSSPENGTRRVPAFSSSGFVEALAS